MSLRREGVDVTVEAEEARSKAACFNGRLRLTINEDGCSAVELQSCQELASCYTTTLYLASLRRGGQKSVSREQTFHLLTAHGLVLATVV